MEARTKKEVLVGMLAIVAVASLVIFFVSKAVLMSEKTYTLHVDFDQQGSLTAGGQVMVTGILAGSIERISFRCDSRADDAGAVKCVRFTLEIQERFQRAIHDDARFRVSNQGLLGESYIAIDPGSFDRPFLEDGDVVQGTSLAGFEAALAQGTEIVHIVSDIISGDPGRLSKIKKVISVFSDPDVASRVDQDRLEDVLGELRSMTEDGTDFMSEARAKYVDDPDIDQAIDQLDDVTSDLNRDIGPAMSAALSKVEHVDDLLSSSDGMDPEEIGLAIEQAASSASRADEMITKANQIVLFVEEGEGTLSSFLKEEEVYDDFREMINDLKYNPWKLLWKD